MVDAAAVVDGAALEVITLVVMYVEPLSVTIEPLAPSGNGLTNALEPRLRLHDCH